MHTNQASLGSILSIDRSVFSRWLRKPGGLAALLMGAYSALQIVLLLSNWLGRPSPLMDRLSFLPLDVAVIAFYFRGYLAERRAGRPRRVWFLVLSAYLCQLLGDGTWSLLASVLGPANVPDPSPADAPYLIYYPLLALALLSLRRSPASEGGHLKRGLDLSMALIGAGMAGWYFFFSFAVSDANNPVTTLSMFAYVAGDLILFLGLAGLLGTHLKNTGSRVPVGTLVAAALCVCLADIIHGHATLTGSAAELRWYFAFSTVSLYLVLLSGFSNRVDSPSSPPSKAGSDIATRAPTVSPIPYFSMAVAYGLLAIAAVGNWVQPLAEMIIGSIILSGIGVVRQVISVRENEQLLAERAARRSEARFRSLVQNSIDMITVVSPEGTILYQSDAVEHVLGRPASETIGTSAFDFLHPDDVPEIAAIWKDLLEHPGISRKSEFRAAHANGTWVYLESVAQNRTEDPNVEGIIINCRDITERVALQERLSYQAFHDPLTGLPNRSLFMERLQQVAGVSSRFLRSGSLAVLYLDIDNFKLINDSLGHHTGDRLLVAVAERIRQCVRPSDTAARLGGDEFAILLEHIHGSESAERVADRIQERLRLPVSLDGQEIFVATSMGIALGIEPGSSAEDLLRKADVALYAAKGRGKARYALFDPTMNNRSLERLQLETDLRRAVERGEFEVWYQPVVSLTTGMITEAEALVRWRHPARGLVSPADFIPAAEETGLILKIGQWVLEQACGQTCEWQNTFPAMSGLVVSVNLSARQFGSQGLVSDIRRTLEQTGFDPSCLKMEITESTTMEDSDATLSILNELKALGIRIAIDDFGIGYSALGYLKRFPVDSLKLDRTFINGLGTEVQDTAIVRATIAFAHTLKLSVTAEGVETSEQVRQLQELGCNLGQGYLFSKPLPAEQFAHLLAEADTLFPTPPKETAASALIN